MSLLSPHVGIVARSAPAGKTPIDDLYAKLTVARGGVLCHARNLVSRHRRACRRSASRGSTARISSSAVTFSTPGWAAARSSAAVRRRGSIRRSITRRSATCWAPISGAFLVVPAACAAVHLAVRPDAVFAGLYRMVRDRHRALSVRLLQRDPARAVCCSSPSRPASRSAFSSARTASTPRRS